MINKEIKQIHPVERYDEAWNLYKNDLQPRKMKLLHLKNLAAENSRNKKPKRFTHPKELFKYYVLHASLHGVRYWIDEQLYRIERFVWFFVVLVGFVYAFKVIYELYDNFQAQRTHIIIDEINSDIFDVTFPSVTLCPSYRVDWKVAKELIKNESLDNEEANDVLEKLLNNLSVLKFGRLQELRIDTTNDSVLEVLNRINITEVMLKVLPKCEKFIISCSWSFEVKNCCSIFERQKTSYGFCYAFNSLTSVDRNLIKPVTAQSYGFRSGLTVTMQIDNLNDPPDTDKEYPMFMISHPFVYPSKGRYIAFGNRYNVDLKFTSAFASGDVLELENDDKPPCRHRSAHYKYENCLGQCQQIYIENKCKCNPTFFFEYKEKVPDCLIKDINCLANISGELIKLHFHLLSEQYHIIKSMCNCPPECEYCSYDDFVISVPDHPNNLSLDIHFDGPTGVRYKREIVVSNLDMLVQFGGIFGLFVGGSILSLIELIYCFLIGISYCLYHFFYHEPKQDKIRNLPFGYFINHV